MSLIIAANTVAVFGERIHLENHLQHDPTTCNNSAPYHSTRSSHTESLRIGPAKGSANIYHGVS